MELVIFLYSVLTLIPSLFRKFTEKLLDDWDQNKATDGEREIANQFKKISVS